MGQLGNVDHIVVLMLENRSFDCILGQLYIKKSENFEGLSGNEQNPDAQGVVIPIWNSPGTDEVTMRFLIRILVSCGWTLIPNSLVLPPCRTRYQLHP